jgi:hypothetical protein
MRDRKILAKLINFGKEVLQGPYYRRHPLQVPSLLAARWRLSNNKGDPEEFLIELGVQGVEDFLADFNERRDFFSTVLNKISGEGGNHGAVSMKHGLVLYVLTRWLEPRKVIETGVAAGASTTFFLAGIHDNGLGELWSIELPSREAERQMLASGDVLDWPRFGVGWAIPSQLVSQVSDRWTLITEDVRVALPPLLRELGSVDMFFHDDLHTPDHMLWQYELVYTRLSEKGILASDDINHAWVTFCKGHGLEDRAYPNVLRLGALRT